MDNHYHLLVETEEGDLSGVQEWLAGDRREQPGLTAWRRRPDWEEVVRAVVSST